MKVIDVIGWDNGFDFEKIVLANKKVKFPSVIHQPILEDFVDVNSSPNFSLEEMLMQFKGEEYFIGEKAIQQSGSGGDRKFSDEKFKERSEIVKLLAGIELLIADEDYEGVRIQNLALGLNIKAFREYKEEIEKIYTARWFEYLVPSGDGYKKRKIYVSKATCFAQGVGAFYDELLDLEGQPVNGDLLDSRYGLIDIGGKTVDGFIADSTDVIRDTVINLKQGTTNAFKRASARLDNIPFNLIQEAYLQDKTKVYYDGNYDIVEPCSREFKRLASDIYDRIQVTWSDHLARMEFVMLCGGGAFALKDHLEELFNKRVIVIADPQFSNARGYYKLGKFMQNN